jgi:hypothetical protein
MEIKIDDSKIQEYAEQRVRTIINNRMNTIDFLFKEILREEISKFVQNHTSEIMEIVKQWAVKEEVTKLAAKRIAMDVADDIRDTIERNICG